MALTRSIGAATAVLSAVALLSLPADAAPKPTLADVQAKFHKIEAANEQLNSINEEVKGAESELSDLSEDIKGVRHSYEQQRAALAGVIVQQQLDAPLGPTINLLASKNPQEFLDGLGAVQAFNSSRADALEQFLKLSSQFKGRQKRLEQRRAALKADQSHAVAKKAAIARDYATAKAQLERLSAADQRAFSASIVTAPDDLPVPSSAVAQAVVSFALAQLGDAYVYGGSGPDSWDCSGLAQGAYRAAGIEIPRVVGPQFVASTQVSMSQIQPGDLLFYANMSHVGIYIGGGRVVHAPHPGTVVSIEGIGRYSFAGRFG